VGGAIHFYTAEIKKQATDKMSFVVARTSFYCLSFSSLVGHGVKALKA